MAITIDATVGGAAANSYATEAAFIAYAATLTNVPAGTTVVGATCAENEKQALVMAFRTMNNFTWLAHRTTSTQSGAWPRSYCPNPDARGINDIVDIADLYYDDDEVPTRVVNAQIEFALAITGAGTTDIFANDTTAGVIEETVDVITTRWQPGQRASGLARYPQVLAPIAPLLDAAAGTLAMVRV